MNQSDDKACSSSRRLNEATSTPNWTWNWLIWPNWIPSESSELEWWLSHRRFFSTTGGAPSARKISPCTSRGCLHRERMLNLPRSIYWRLFWLFQWLLFGCLSHSTGCTAPFSCSTPLTKSFRRLHRSTSSTVPMTAPRKVGAPSLLKFIIDYDRAPKEFDAK